MRRQTSARCCIDTCCVDSRGINADSHSTFAGHKSNCGFSVGPMPELLAKVKANTELWKSVGAESVPFLPCRNPANDQIATFSGAVDTPALRQMHGL